MAQQGGVVLPGTLVNNTGVGGLVGGQIKNIQDIGVDTSGVIGAAGQVAGVGQKLADTGPGVAGGGNIRTGQQTLSGLLGTGLPTDTARISESQRALSQQQFQDFLGQSKEEFGALGLGSSSAREAADAREAARLAAQSEAQGAGLEFAASEAAKGRQLGAFGPLQGAQGLRQAGQIAGGGLFGAAGGLQQGAASLGLQGQLGQAQAGQGLINSLPVTGQGGFGGGGFGGGGGGIATRPIGAPQIGGLVQRARLQRGGQVGSLNIQPGATFGGRTDPRDFFSNLLFGRSFSRPTPVSAVRPQRPRVPQPQFAEPRSDFRQQRRLERLQRRGRGETFDPIAFITQLGQAGRNIGTGQGTGIGQPTDFQRGALALGGNLGKFLIQTAGRGFQEGGEVQGPANPPDQVPILATGGEIVVPRDLVAELAVSTNPDPLIQQLQELIGKPGEGEGNEFQVGGQPLPTAQGNQFLGALGEAVGGTPVFGNTAAATAPDIQGAGGAGGTLSSFGTPTLASQLQGEDPEVLRLLERRQLVEAGLNNFQAAIASGTKGTNANLLPFIERSRNDLALIDEEINAKRAANVAQQQAVAEQERARGLVLQGEAAQQAQDIKLQQLQGQIPEQEFQLIQDLSKPDTFGSRLSPREVLERASQTLGPNASPQLLQSIEELPPEETQAVPALAEGEAAAELNLEDPFVTEQQVASGQLSPEQVQQASDFTLQFMQQARRANPQMTSEQFFLQFQQQFPALAALASQSFAQ